MKDPLNRTKVVLRHLPPSISQLWLMEQIVGRFSGRYKWFSFRPGKNSQKNQRCSRAYIDFQSPEDVLEFAEFFYGRIFVNEKGSQFKALVEYAPSQRVPKQLSKKDGREGTIFKAFFDVQSDPEYVQFLEFISKPVENLPSAEIQLERREAERAGGPKEAVIVTPLMDFIHQKQAAKGGSQRSSANGKLSRRAGGAPSSSSSSSKRGSEKRRGLTSVYVLRDGAKTSSSGKDKSTCMLVSRKEEQHTLASRTEVPEDGSGLNGTIHIASGSVEIGKRRVALLKGKERKASHVSDGSSQQQNATASVRKLAALASSTQSQRHDTSGRIIRSILSNKDTRQSQSYLAGIQSEQQSQEVNSEKDKRPPRPPNPRVILKDHTTSIATYPSVPYRDGKRSLDEKTAVNNLHGFVSTGDKNERRMRNKDRPDRGVWTPRRSDGVHVSDDTYLSTKQSSDSLESISLYQQTVVQKDGDDVMSFQSAHGGRGSNSGAAYDAPLNHGEIRSDVPNSIAESRSGRANFSSAENGAHRHVGCPGSAHGTKEVDGSLSFSDGKTSKRGVSAGYGSHERQVWVQKSGSGS